MTTTKSACVAVFVGPNRPVEVREYPILPPEPQTARLKLEMSGICGTDLHIVEGRLPVPPPFIPGHEFIGRIEALGIGAQHDGAGQSLQVGDRVIACVAMPCGQCFNCRRDETASCLNFGVTNFRDPVLAPHFFGGFSEILHHPARCLVKVPEGLDLAAVAAFPCAGPTALRALAYAGGLEKGELVVVQGTGPVGLFAVAYAAQAGCEVIAIGSGSTPARLALAGQLGAEAVLDYRQIPPERRLELVRQKARELGRGDGADVVFEASGAPGAVPEGLNLVRTRGRYLIPGQYSASGGIEIQPQLITFKAIRLIGSGQYTLADIKTYLEFLDGHSEMQKLFAACISHRYSVSAAPQALAEVSAGQTVKGVFVC